MNIVQTIHNSLGINIFGSALIRIEPDIASLNFAISHLAQHLRMPFVKRERWLKTLKKNIYDLVLHTSPLGDFEYWQVVTKAS